jgi:fluoride exporter
VNLEAGKAIIEELQMFLLGSRFMHAWVFVCLGGGLGALARFSLAGFLHRRYVGSMPIGTLAVNVVGCFLAGILFASVFQREDLDPRMRHFLGAGLLGAFTTFSTFGAETLALFREDRVSLALGNVALNVVAGLLAVWAGHALVKLFMD